MQKILSAVILTLLAGQAWAQSAAVLVYQVFEEDVDAYFSRIIVTDQYVRLDEGADQSNYTLFDRNAEVIYNISYEDNMILEMRPEVDRVPSDPGLILGVKKTVDEEAPLVAGQKPLTVEFLANGEPCGKVVAVKGPMEPALQGLREFKKVLARVQGAGVALQPDSLQMACDLAANVFAPTRALDYGLPLEEHSSGRVQLLNDYIEQQEVDEALFIVPEGMQRLEMPNLPVI